MIFGFSRRVSGLVRVPQGVRFNFLKRNIDLVSKKEVFNKKMFADSPHHSHQPLAVGVILLEIKENP